MTEKTGATTRRGWLGVAGGLLAVGLVAQWALGSPSEEQSAQRSSDDSSGVVTRVIDGDTLVVDIAGKETTVRLLNVDTPETKDPSAPVECLGPEATAYLEGRLPPGTTVGLTYDVQRLDQYGRTLAGVHHSDSLVNAEIAREGLGVSAHFAPNDRHLAEVETAQREAVSAGRGLFDTAQDCTIPGQVAALEASAGVPAEAVATVAGVSALLHELNSGALPLVRRTSHAWGRAGLSAVKDRLRATRSRAERHQRPTKAPKASATGPTAQPRPNAGSARRSENDQPRQRATPRSPSHPHSATRPSARPSIRSATRPSTRPSAPRSTTRPHVRRPPRPKKTTPAKSSGPAGYTGPRCYAPGGRSWKPC